MASVHVAQELFAMVMYFKFWHVSGKSALNRRKYVASMAVDAIITGVQERLDNGRTAGSMWYRPRVLGYAVSSE